MCHSVEMYMPRMTERLAERRIGAEVSSATEGQRRTVTAIGALVAGLKSMLPGRAAGIGRGAIQERLTDV